MRNMEMRKFEESFQNAFSGAEVSPSESVWANVELVLEKNSGGKMKGRLLFFQLLAAASMVFAMGVGGIYYLDTRPNDFQPVNVKNPEISNVERSKKNSDILAKTTDGVENSHNDVKADEDKQVKKLDVSKTEKDHIAAGTQSSLVSYPAKEELSVASSDNGLITKRALPKLVEIEQPVFSVTKQEPTADPGMVLLARLRDEELKYQEKQEPETNEKLWTSIGMSAGTFKPNASSSSPSTMSAFGTSPVTSDPSAGLSYSVGINVATKLAERVFIQGGISYLNQAAEFTSSTTKAGSRVTLNEFANYEQKAVASSPYKVNSNLQFMSIPVQAGYIIIDRQFAVQINGGVATDIFFQSTLTSENTDLDRVTQGAGDDSPYRTVNFSGLLGTELSYKIGDHYRIALNPGLRYALNSIYKSEVSAQVSPMTFDVGLRFRYIFK